MRLDDIYPMVYRLLHSDERFRKNAKKRSLPLVMGRTIFICIIFSNSLWFKSSFKFTKSRNSVFQKKSNFRYCFLSIFWIVCRNEAYNILLDSYVKCAASSCWTLFDIHRGLRAVSKIVRAWWYAASVFSRFFSKLHIGMKQTIRRWKDIVELHRFHTYYFL